MRAFEHPGLRRLGFGSEPVRSLRWRNDELRPQPDPHMGSMVSFGRHVLGLYEQPKLVDPLTGTVIAAWPEIASGRQESAILHHLDPMPPPFAADPTRSRFAIADATDVLVVDLPTEAM